MQRLKAWQLEQLGMSEDYKGLEAYCRLCQGQRPNSSEELLETAGVLEEIWKANQVTREYAPSLLRSSFKSILLASMANLKRKDAIAVCQATSLVSRSDYRRYGLKQKIKRLLGR